MHFFIVEIELRAMNEFKMRSSRSVFFSKPMNKEGISWEISLVSISPFMWPEGGKKCFGIISMRIECLLRLTISLVFLFYSSALKTISWMNTQIVNERKTKSKWQIHITYKQIPSECVRKKNNPESKRRTIVIELAITLLIRTNDLCRINRNSLSMEFFLLYFIRADKVLSEKEEVNKMTIQLK